ncbi:MAG: F-box protein, partial [Alphaproteobacteria bacterium]
MNPSAKSFMYAYSALLLLNASFAMPGKEEAQAEAQEPAAPQVISKKDAQENQFAVAPIQCLPDSMFSEIFKHLSSRDQLSFTQTNKKFRGLMKVINSFTARELPNDQVISPECYQWLKKLTSLSRLTLGNTQKFYDSELKLTVSFSDLQTFLQDSKLSFFSFKNNFVGGCIGQASEEFHNLIGSLPNTLQELDLSNNTIWGEPSFIKGILEKLALKPNLRVLRLSYNHDLGDGLWQESAILQALTQTRIEKLHLEHTS